MRTMIEIIEKVLVGFEDGSMHHVFNGDNEDPFALRAFEEGCVEFNKDLFAWRNLRHKTNASDTTEEIKQQFRKSTASMYQRIVNRQSIGILLTDKNQQFQETIALMEQRIETLKAEKDRCAQENKMMVKELAEYRKKEAQSDDKTQAIPAKEFRGVG